MLRTFCCVLLLAAIGNSFVRAEVQQPPGRMVLLVVDDLNLDFRSTPRLRELVTRLVQPIARDGNLCSLISTGTSGVWVPPTTDATTLGGAVTRLVGNGLRFNEMPGTPLEANYERELRHRANVAFSAAADAIESAGTNQPGRPLAILWVSSGYDNGVVFEANRLVQAARRVNASLNTIDMRTIVNPTAPAGISQADWDAHATVTQGSLRALASQTQGVAAFTADDVDALVSRITQPGR